MADPENPDTAAKSDQPPADKSDSGQAGAGSTGGEIGLTMQYITSIPGILKMVEFVCTSTLLCLIYNFVMCNFWKFSPLIILVPSRG